jgi:glutathione synthase/RimK-type ligase-like ATP-grasp enzyme
MPDYRLAVAVTAEYPDLLPDWPLLRASLAARGVAAETVPWTDLEAPWASFDLVLANGVWNYIHQGHQFTHWIERVDAVTRVVNPPHVLRWNRDKRYLDALATAGVPVVPTQWIAPTDETVDDTVSGWTPPTEWDESDESDESDEYVLKPTVSGGGFETARYRGDDPAARHHMARLLTAGRTVMVQPYQAAIDAHGEVGLVFVGGTYSHAISKNPLLKPNAGARRDLIDELTIAATEPNPEQRRVAELVMARATELLGPLTYARVDLVPGNDGVPLLLELELLDPALYLDLVPGAVDRFVGVLMKTLVNTPSAT